MGRLSPIGCHIVGRKGCTERHAPLLHPLLVLFRRFPLWGRKLRAKTEATSPSAWSAVGRGTSSAMKAFPRSARALRQAVHPPCAAHREEPMRVDRGPTRMALPRAGRRSSGQSPPLPSIASSTLGGDSGRSSMRNPNWSRTALDNAASGATIGVSPTPRTP